jgi:Cell morphogenesis central region
MHLVTARPKYRSALLTEMAGLVERVPADPESHAHAVRGFLQLGRHWLACLERERGMQAGERGAATATALDVPRLEAFALLAAVSPAPRVRAAFPRVLATIRDLHMCAVSRVSHACILHIVPTWRARPGHVTRAPAPWGCTRASLLAPAERRHAGGGMARGVLCRAEEGIEDSAAAGVYAATAIEQLGDDAVREAYWDTGPYSHVMKRYRSAPADARLAGVLEAKDVARWAATLPVLVRHLEALCPQTARAAYDQVRAPLPLVSWCSAPHDCMPATGLLAMPACCDMRSVQRA